MFCLEFSGLHYCLFVKVLFFLLEVFPEELSFLSLRQLIEFIISSSVCQELFSFYFQVSFETWLLITRSNSSLFYQNFLFMSSSFLLFGISFQKSVLLSFAATVIKYIRTVCRCQVVLYFFDFLFPFHKSFAIMQRRLEG